MSKIDTEHTLQDVLRDHRLYLETGNRELHADLRSANLRFADLRSANLRFADLRFADLSFADLPKGVYIFQGSKHQCIASYGMIRIGCENHKIDFWTKNYKNIGIKAGYDKDEIKDYGELISWYAKRCK